MCFKNRDAAEVSILSVQGGKENVSISVEGGEERIPVSSANRCCSLLMLHSV